MGTGGGHLSPATGHPKAEKREGIQKQRHHPEGARRGPLGGKKRGLKKKKKGPPIGKKET